ncbi:YdcF family protein [Labrenzia sp. PHM005]|uniref:YdcF family protein n=1 Tax=Labrenzia sp. PHM005 TaxID=2590016 RepID=UPI00114041C0|nr:YdcF family protein [Labrenzia sp. PHM005]QDG77165.1 YdcF family protein [Labrenzia sp. PHM005]
MFFYISKIAYFFIQPSNVLVAMVVLGGLMSLRPRSQVWGRRLAFLGALGFLVCGFSPAANFLMLPLEERFSRPEQLGSYDGVIILGGAVDTVISGARGDTALTLSGERLTIAARLARALPGASIIHTGGQGVIISGQTTESEGAARLFADFGIDENRIILEDASRNTWENAVLTKKIVDPQPGQNWLLVTSAYHMPRSMGVFEAAGWTGVTPYPVDYRTRGANDRTLGFNGASKGLRRFDLAFKEWVGMTVYWMTGRSSAWFPGPDTAG